MNLAYSALPIHQLSPSTALRVTCSRKHPCKPHLDYHLRLINSEPPTTHQLLLQLRQRALQSVLYYDEVSSSLHFDSRSRGSEFGFALNALRRIG